MALLRQGKATGRLVVLVQALTTPTLVAAAAMDSQPAGSFVQGSNVPAVLQVCLHILFDQSCSGLEVFGWSKDCLLGLIDVLCRHMLTDSCNVQHRTAKSLTLSSTLAWLALPTLRAYFPDCLSARYAQLSVLGWHSKIPAQYTTWP